ncbi:hypothetical protein DU500_10615 [Haloplanus rubicundus]|uniref:Uncharacterized protein n=1 Tax=Haloplanus rubicundus TaxID=1547898 RepID=A0A345EDE6_9EURY|nr:hypothetical protein [Haloplanus rubicundus]AXG06844.1 hypothetical protein DU500_10615 [Haloplanus rubicundus]AXG10218.1 hypothetical protein DU484_10370 [Haloplanus rubicundus]
MYDSEFDTDWDDLDKAGALERAFALGVARSLGTPNREEYERVRDAADTTYERSMIELSYEEGRRKASGRAAEKSAVWEELVVETEPVDATGSPADPRTRTRTRDGPPSMTARPEPTVVPEDGLDRIRLPEFLRRR